MKQLWKSALKLCVCVWTRESGLGLRRPKPITCGLELVCHGWGPLFISVLPRRRVITVTFRKTITWAPRGCARFYCRLPGLLGVTPDFGARVTYGCWEVASRVGGVPTPQVTHTRGAQTNLAGENLSTYCFREPGGERRWAA